MRPTVLLFDVDDTLVTTGGAGRRAVDRAFADLHGRADACSTISFAGMTDRAIVRQGLLVIGREPSAEAIDQVLAHYVRVLAEEVGRAEASSYRLHAGVREAVEAGLASGAAVGLGTGNIREGARVKLARVGIAERFRFGGFGDDHELRAELLRVGAERGAEQLGRARAEVRVVVIGDTPKDVAAAQAIGAESLAVATGHFSVRELEAAGATKAVADLAVAGALEWMLGR